MCAASVGTVGSKGTIPVCSLYENAVMTTTGFEGVCLSEEGDSCGWESSFQMGKSHGVFQDWHASSDRHIDQDSLLFCCAVCKPLKEQLTQIALQTLVVLQAVQA